MLALSTAVLELDHDLHHNFALQGRDLLVKIDPRKLHPDHYLPSNRLCSQASRGRDREVRSLDLGYVGGFETEASPAASSRPVPAASLSAPAPELPRRGSRRGRLVIERSRVTEAQALEVPMTRDRFVKTFGKSGAGTLEAANAMLGTEKLPLRLWMRKSLEALAASRGNVARLKRSYEEAFITPVPAAAPVLQPYLQSHLYHQQPLLPHGMHMHPPPPELLYPQGQVVPATPHQAASVPPQATMTPLQPVLSQPGLSAPVRDSHPPQVRAHPMMAAPATSVVHYQAQPHPPSTQTGMDSMAWKPVRARLSFRADFLEGLKFSRTTNVDSYIVNNTPATASCLGWVRHLCDIRAF